MLFGNVNIDVNNKLICQVMLFGNVYVDVNIKLMSHYVVWQCLC